MASGPGGTPPPPGRNATETLAEDREAFLLADRLGYSEAFVGEKVEAFRRFVGPQVQGRQEPHHPLRRQPDETQILRTRRSELYPPAFEQTPLVTQACQRRFTGQDAPLFQVVTGFHPQITAEAGC